MKIIKILLVMIFLTPFIYSQSVNICGRFVELIETSTVYSIKLQLSSSTGENDMGGATFVISFDPNTLAFPNSPSSGNDFAFHNFSGGSYATGTVTRPGLNQIWVNVELLQDNLGNIIGNSESWTDLVTLNFNKINSIVIPKIEWKTDSPFWSIYDGDNKTLWDTDFFNSVTIIEDDIEDTPKDYQLSQNYPNPFNPVTTLKYALPQSGDVKIIIYDISGSKITELVNGQQSAGNYEVTWDGKNDFGSSVVSGTYIYRIQAGEYVQSRKMILLK
jgi:hypothetical protein